MSLRHVTRAAICGALGILVGLVALTASGPAAVAPLALNTARITIEGNSNLHPYTASTPAVRLGRVAYGDIAASDGFWQAITQPGALQAFEVTIPAATLASPKDGLDKNMHKALKVAEHPDIVFRLARLEPRAAGAYKAIGTLTIAGVAKEVSLDIITQANDGAMTVKGEIQLLMTDFGIAPPKAMLGMLKTDPRVTVKFETVLAIALT
jgi:polyisoprenoid-binding protein YceI